MEKIIDLSVPIDINFWEPEKIDRIFINHQKGADILGKSHFYFSSSNLLKKIFHFIFHKKKIISRKDFPNEMGLSNMFYKISTHTGTHIDAPFHYGWNNMNKKPKTIEKLPLELFIGNGVLLDFRSEILIDKKSVIKKLNFHNYEIASGDIVLINTGASKLLGTKEYFLKYKPIQRDVIEFLVKKGIKVIGTDAFSFDPPFVSMIDEYKKSKNKGLLWPAHFYGREFPYIQIERLGNLEEIPLFTGFKFCCFPIKLNGADAAWTRAVAIIK